MLQSHEFDLWADDYDRTVGLTDDQDEYPFAGYRQVLGAIYQRIRQDKSIHSILDVGFGTAALTSRLYGDGYAITGLDFSPRMIEIAQEKMPQAALICHDLSQGFPKALESASFDCIISTYALHHLTDAQKAGFLTQCLKHAPTILLGDVAFPSAAALEDVRRRAGDEWDDEEYYFVFDKLPRLEGAKAAFTPYSFCAGVIEIGYTIGQPIVECPACPGHSDQT